MKSILLKIEDELFEDLKDSIKDVKVSRTSFIKNAISDAIATVKRNKLAKELKREITLINEQSVDKTLIEEFESASLSDLQNHLNES